jgi:hypothetical protein
MFALYESSAQKAPPPIGGRVRMGVKRNKCLLKLQIRKNCILFFLFLLSAGYNVQAQVPLPLNHEIIQRLEPEILKHNPSFFTVLKPYDEEQLRKIINVDSLLDFDEGRKRSTWFGRKLFDESFLQIDSTEFSLHIDPVFNFSAGKEFGNSQNLIGNARGAMVRCRIGQTIGIESAFYENQSFFPQVWDQFIAKYRVAPGQGRAKRYHVTGWDYAYSEGAITWHPKGIFLAQLGRGKNFIGEGYRSLLLSDAATNYPYLRFSFSCKNFQYTRITALLQNIDYRVINKDTREFPQKLANFHLISFNTFRKFQVSLFEGIILNNPDTRGKFTVNFDVVNPVPFIDVLFRSKDNETKINSIGGINLCWRISPVFQLYSQMSVDDPIHKKLDGKTGISEYGYQLGFKYYNPLQIKNFYLQFEYNEVRPFTYSQGDSVISYSHFDQPLAHPLGANFYEVVGISNYRYKRFYAEYTLTLAKYGASTSGNNAGHEILLTPGRSSDAFLQGVKTDLITHQARMAWYINPATNSCISAGVYWQNQKSSVINSSTKMFYISFSTNLRNLYYDF